MRRGRGPSRTKLEWLELQKFVAAHKIPTMRWKRCVLFASFRIKCINIHTKTVPLSKNMSLSEQYFSQRGQTFLLFPCLSNCLDQTPAIKWNQLWTQQWDIFWANTSFRSSIRYLLTFLHIKFTLRSGEK